jgi:hypothetical protein
MWRITTHCPDNRVEGNCHHTKRGSNVSETEDSQWPQELKNMLKSLLMLCPGLVLMSLLLAYYDVSLKSSVMIWTAFVVGLFGTLGFIQYRRNRQDT